MLADKFDFKKQFKDLYLPKSTPSLIEVPSMRFLSIDGSGDPKSPEYQNAVGALFALSYTIKMSRKAGIEFDGYFDYVVPPLEGLWWVSEGLFEFDKRDNWLWTSMIRQPDFVTDDVFYRALEQCRRKKPDIDFSKVSLKTFEEGLCVQVMHTGPFMTEPETVNLMKSFMAQNNLVDDTGNVRKHHEIYLSDFNKTDVQKLKTILRHPVHKNL